MHVVAILVSGDFHIHRADCADLTEDQARSRPYEATTYGDVARWCYADFIPYEMDIGEALDYLTFHPCCTEGLRHAPIR
jgi:hypothetical protein